MSGASLASAAHRGLPGARAAVLLAAAACVACGARERTAPPASAPAALRPASREPESCRPCHPGEVERFLASSHRLAARRIDDAAQPLQARFSTDAPVDELARDEGSVVPRDEAAAPQLHVADAAGASEARTISHVMGGRRREDFLALLPDGPHVLPLAWSVTRATWTSPLAEELGGSVAPTSPLWWTTGRRAHASACSRCHALPQDEAAAGLACSSCHGDATSHVAAKSGSSDAAPWATGLRRLDASNLHGCAACHATGNLRPKDADTPADAPVTDLLLPATLAGPGGFDVDFIIDGRPAVAHGLEVQALAQSACFLKGGATCTTCHDPHGADADTSLKDRDPDGSCRGCHAEIAANARGHARHAVATEPVPLARREPSGPPLASAAGARAPGCVDCHAPADVPFGKGDMARDHAIGVPAPDAAAEAGMVDACMACHADRAPQQVARDFAKAWPARGESARLRRARAFAMAARQDRDRERTAAMLRGVLEDDSAGPWVQASAAALLGRTGASPETAAALERAWSATTDPVLAIAAMSADAAAGGPAQPLRDRMLAETDWRVKLAAAAGLAARDDEQALTTLEAIHGGASLPAIARADAGVELATILIRRRSCRRAESILGDALATDPASVPAWLNLGVARACQGNADGARNAFERVLELAPGNALARANLAALEQSTAP